MVGSIESSLRSLTYILPGRFPHAEIAAEAVFSFVSVLGLYHDNILRSSAVSSSSHPFLLSSDQPPVSSSFNKFIQHLHHSRAFPKLHIVVAYCDNLAQRLQVLVEMISLEFVGPLMRDRTILSIECFKIIARLFLFFSSGRRMILHSCIPERDYDENNLSSVSSSSRTATTLYTGRRTQKHIVSIPLDHLTKEEFNFISSKALVSSGELKSFSGINLVSRLRGSAILGELIHIIRPLVYLLATFKYRRSKTKSWRPWILSFVLDIISLLLLCRRQDAQPPMKTLELSELTRRVGGLSYYLLRNPFYDRFTKLRLQSFCESSKKRMILSFVGGVLSDYILLWDKYYFLVNP